MSRWRIHIAYLLLTSFVVGGVGGNLVHHTVRDVAERASDAHHAVHASYDTAPVSPTYYNVCPHEHDTEFDCLLCNTFVLGISPGLSFISDLDTLTPLALRPQSGDRERTSSLNLIRAPPQLAS